MKFPRKLKKKLKSILMNSLPAGVWHEKEVQVTRFETYYHSDKTPKLNYNGKTITGYKLSPR